MNTYHDLIKQKIQSLVPEIMELKEGCHITLKSKPDLVHTIYGNDEGLYMAYLNKPFPPELGMNDFYDLEFGTTVDVIILGRPIQLADVLTAMSKVGCMTECIDRLLFLDFSKDDIQWNLSESFDGQSDECKEFVGGLLGVIEKDPFLSLGKNNENGEVSTTFNGKK